eukprot:TRINITY_DN2222_c0_g1_i10.p1 TRINITY_DN2222_c0_g1~~TRINITY_DN2222_c0_g1_i10.p1  ORF type:complete len:863 (+),score=280.00 TRINITY_DN2222_c0_g1_i10:906-3494(+)
MEREAELESEHGETFNKVKKLEEELVRMKDESTALLAQKDGAAEQLNEKIIAAENGARKLSAECESFKAEAERLQLVLEEKVADAAALEQAAGEARAKLIAVESEKTLQEINLEASGERTKELEDVLREKAEELEKALHTKEQLSTTIEELEMKLSSAQAEMERLREEKGAALETATQEELVRVRDELDLVSGVRRELQTDCTAAQQALEDEKAKYLSLEGDLESARTALFVMKEKAENDKVDNTQNFDSLQAEHEKQAAELSVLRTDLDQQVAMKTSFETKAVEATAAVDASAQELARLTATLEEKDGSLKKLQDDIFKMETELSQQSDELRDRREAALSQEKTITSMGVQLEELEREAGKDRAQAERLLENEQNFKKQLEVSNKSLVREGELQARVRQLEEEAASMHESLMQLRLTEQELADVNEKGELLEAKVRTLQTEAQDADERERALRHSLDENETSNEETLWGLQARLDETLQTVTVLKQELQAERDNASSVQAAHAVTIATLESQLTQSAMQGSAMLGTIEEIKATSKQQKLDCERSIQLLTSSSNTMQAKLSASTTQCEELNAQLLKAELQVSTLKARLTDARDEKLENVQAELDERNKELHTLKIHLSNTETANRGFGEEEAKLREMEEALLQQKLTIEEELRQKHDSLVEKERCLVKMHDDLKGMRETAEVKYDEAVMREKLLSSRLHTVEQELKRSTAAPVETDRLSQIEDLLCQAFNEVRHVENTLHNRTVDQHSVSLQPAMPPHRYREATEAFSPPRLSNRSVSPPISKMSGASIYSSRKKDESVGRRLAAIENRILSTRAPHHHTTHLPPPSVTSRTSRDSSASLNPSFRSSTKRAIGTAFNGSVIK